MPKASSNHSSVLTEHQLETGRQTLGHGIYRTMCMVAYALCCKNILLMQNGALGGWPAGTDC